MQQKSPCLSTRTAQYFIIRYFRHAHVSRRVDAHMFDLALGYAAVCLLRQPRFACGAKQAACGVRLAVCGRMNAIFTHASISS